MTSVMILMRYLLVAAYGLKLAWTGETYDSRQVPVGIGITREGLVFLTEVLLSYNANTLIRG